MSQQVQPRLKQARGVRFSAVIIALLWSVLLAISLAWNIINQHEKVLTDARLQADAYINKDMSFRSWATAHGGVYVRPDEKSPPNPYLKVPDRDVVTTGGIKLTLVNPAYMMRQVLEGFSAPYGIRGHLTSLKLMNPNNAPDPWEREALLSFDRGVKEVHDTAKINGKPVLRYMRPVYVEQGCLKCHKDMDYKVGEIRGGISTMVDMEPLEAASAKFLQGMYLTHGLVWLVGLLGIGATTRRFEQRAIERERSMQEIRSNEQRALALLSLDEKAWKLDEREVLQEGLEEAERLTASKMAFLHFVNEDQQSIELVAWSRRTKEQCQAVFDEHYPIDKAGVWADCARMKQPVVHNDYQKLPNKRGYPAGHSFLVRELTVPVLEEGKVRLIIGVGNKESNYDEADARLLQMIANDLWKVVRRRRVEEALKSANEEMELRVQQRTRELSQANDKLSNLVGELQQHHHEMQLVNRLNDLLLSCQKLDEAYRVIEISLREIFSRHGGMLTMMDKERQCLEQVVRWGTTTCEENFLPDDCWAMRQGHAHWVTDLKSDLLCNHFSETPKGGYLCLPLVVSGEIMGLLHLEMREGEAAERSDSLRSLAAMVGEAIKLGLSNVSLRIALREQATHDPLTGLHNRRYLEDTLSREMHRAARSGLPLCAVMIDIDHFKLFNDTHGHEAGDTALRAIGHMLQENLRKSDVAVRYGGEEITIIMPDSSLEDVQQRVEQLRQMVGQLELQVGGGKTATITISAGVARLQGTDMTPDQLLRAADRALYAAKVGGRNQMVVSANA